MEAWQKMAWDTDANLARYSSATKNLACAAGLPDTENWNPAACLGRIKEMAEKAQWRTVRNLRKFERAPEDFRRSQAYFRCFVLVDTLQQNCGIHYNPAKIPEDVPLDVADTFVYGAVMGDGGTCASLPVLYATVGQYLGYPMWLVGAKTPK